MSAGALAKAEADPAGQSLRPAASQSLGLGPQKEHTFGHHALARLLAREHRNTVAGRGSHLDVPLHESSSLVLAFDIDDRPHADHLDCGRGDEEAGPG